VPAARVIKGFIKLKAAAADTDMAEARSYCSSDSSPDDRAIEDTSGSEAEENEKAAWQRSSSIAPLSPRIFVVGNMDMMSIPWFHPNLTRHHAEAELLLAEEGVYLMRPRISSSGEVEGYSMDVRCQHSVKHFRVEVIRNRIEFGQETFRDVQSFIDHFDNCPLIGDDAAKLIVFKYPYPREIDEIHDYTLVTTHFVHGKSKVPTERERHTYSLASKEGYLVKLGAVVKSWKNRWFVLRNEELSYYAREKDKEPIRIIKLKDVEEVSPCELSQKKNAFRVILPWRTFYLQAPSREVRDDWIQILQWKLKELQQYPMERDYVFIRSTSP